MDEVERRQALAAFLRTRRARLQPADVGLPTRSRRRTPGLRREEVAELADIGVSWYTLLEQGQNVHPSRKVLESLAQALKLTASERQHLFRLAGHESSVPLVEQEVSVPPALQCIVDTLDPHPTFVIGRRWDLLTWNRPAGWLFQFDEPCPPYPRNVLWRFFRREARAIDHNWATVAQNLVAGFRADYVRYPDDPSFQEIIDDLQQISDKFRLWWDQQNVRELPHGPRLMDHPTLGRLEFDHMSFQTVTPDLHVKIYTASPATMTKLEAAIS
jgi:transcriptional regulator with XRE-family HTH domain